MAQTDLGSILSLVFGGSGIAAWVLIYFQMRNERRKQGLEYFRQIVLTPDFVHYLGILFSLLSAFCGEGLKTKDDVQSIRRDVIELNKYGSMIQGTIFFLPPKVLNALNEADDSVGKMIDLLLEGNHTAIPDAWKHATFCTGQLALELKKVLGIEITTS